MYETMHSGIVGCCRKCGRKGWGLRKISRETLTRLSCRPILGESLTLKWLGESMRKIVAFGAFALALGVAAPAFADCAGHAVTAQTKIPDTTQTAQTTVKTTLPSDQKGG